MAQPITWKNVVAPDNSGSAGLLYAAQQGFSNATSQANNLSNIFTTAAKNQREGVENEAYQSGLSALASTQDPNEVSALLSSDLLSKTGTKQATELYKMGQERKNYFADSRLKAAQMSAEQQNLAHTKQKITKTDLELKQLKEDAALEADLAGLRGNMAQQLKTIQEQRSEGQRAVTANFGNIFNQYAQMGVLTEDSIPTFDAVKQDVFIGPDSRLVFAPNVNAEDGKTGTGYSDQEIGAIQNILDQVNKNVPQTQNAEALLKAQYSEQIAQLEKQYGKSISTSKVWEDVVGKVVNTKALTETEKALMDQREAALKTEQATALEQLKGTYTAETSALKSGSNYDVTDRIVNDPLNQQPLDIGSITKTLDEISGREKGEGRNWDITDVAETIYDVISEGRDTDKKESLLSSKTQQQLENSGKTVSSLKGIPDSIIQYAVRQATNLAADELGLSGIREEHFDKRFRKVLNSEVRKYREYEKLRPKITKLDQDFARANAQIETQGSLRMALLQKAKTN